VAEPRLPPSPLERAIGQLIEAGVADRDHLAACLGLEPRHVARPLRHLLLASAVRQEPDGGLRLTDAGRTWLAVEAIAPTVDMAGGPPLPAPRLRPLDLDVEVAPLPDETPAAVDHPAGQRWSPRIPDLARRRRLSRWTQVLLHSDQLGSTRSGIAFVRATRLAAGVVGKVVLPVLVIAALLAGARAGLAERTVAAAGTLVAGRGALAAATPAVATSMSPLAAASPSPSPAAPSPIWRVAHTDGLGLVLRPRPASPARLRTLPDGTLVHVTGDAVQQSGRAWLPVQAPSGEGGWVAAEFLDLLP